MPRIEHVMPPRLPKWGATPCHPCLPTSPRLGAAIEICCANEVETFLRIGTHAASEQVRGHDVYRSSWPVVKGRDQLPFQMGFSRSTGGALSDAYLRRPAATTCISPGD